jgi:L-fuculose-phosphate aldolase
VLKEFQKIGKDLFLAGLNSSHSGNMSIRSGDRIFITRRGAMLGHLEKEDIIETELWKNDSKIILASTEIGIHRAIYKSTSALAVIHAHPPHAVALSLLTDDIVPIDSEGAYLLHRVPVLSAVHTIGSKELEKSLPEALKQYKVAVVRGHGSFAVGQLLEEAYQWTSSLESSCRIIYLYRTLGGVNLAEYNFKGKYW